MGELRRDLDHAEKPAGTERLSEVGTQHLHGDPAPVLQVLGEVHRRHATLPDLALDPVAIGERGGKRAGHERDRHAPGS